MNNKQILIAVLAAIAITLIVIFTPRYKIIWIDSNNYIKTEQTSSLYKRTRGKENLYWDKIGLYSGVTIVSAGLLIFRLRK